MKKLAVQLGFGFRLTKRRGELVLVRHDKVFGPLDPCPVYRH